MNKLWISLGLTAGFIVVLLLVYWVHSSFFQVDVVLYSALFDGVIATTLGSIALFVGRRRWPALTEFECVQLAVIWFLGSYIFAISVPTVLDRSLSFYLLEKIEQRGGGIRHAAFAEVFTREYLVEHRLVDVRLTEQLESGTIEIVEGCVRLTDRGRRLAGFSRYFRRHFLPRQRLLMGEYSDDLTDPFRHSAEAEDYRC